MLTKTRPRPHSFFILVLTCKSLNNAISRTSSPHLYARIFRQQFDSAALVRRFPSEERTAQHLSEELVRRWETLGRVRRLERVQTAEPDLWVLYLMCIENGAWLDLLSLSIYMRVPGANSIVTRPVLSDGRNLDQLINYADLPTYLQRFRKERLSPPILSTHGTFERLSQELPSETTDRALALWIDWYTSGVTDYCKESSNERASALQMLRLYVFAAQRVGSHGCGLISLNASDLRSLSIACSSSTATSSLGHISSSPFRVPTSLRIALCPRNLSFPLSSLISHHARALSPSLASASRPCGSYRPSPRTLRYSPSSPALRRIRLSPVRKEEALLLDIRQSHLRQPPQGGPPARRRGGSECRPLRLGLRHPMARRRARILTMSGAE